MAYVAKALKYGTFTWDDDAKLLMVDRMGQQVMLDKTYMFALSRFITRLSQRAWFRRKAK